MPVQRFLPLVATLLAMPVCADDLFFSELPVVASVSRLPQRIADAPASVTVIDRDMIRASGARSLNDIFRLVPGFQTFAHSDTSARVNYHGITDHNDYSPRVQVLLDGRSLHSPLFRNGVNWGLIPVALEDIERIEVVRGSNTVSYGTNAFLGVVNIITVDPSLVQGGSVAINRGTQGVRDHTLRVGQSFGEGGAFRLTYQEVRDDGLEDDYDWQDRFRNRRLDLRVDQYLTNRDLLEMNFGFVQGESIRGRLDDGLFPLKVSEGDDPIRRLDESSAWMQLKWTRTLSNDEDMVFRYVLQEDRGDDSFRYLGKKYNQAGEKGWRQELEFQHRLSPVTDVRMVWGAGWRNDKMRSATMLPDAGRVGRDIWRIFSSAEWRPKPWLTANLGAAHEHDSLAGNHFSPRASLAFHLSQEDTVRLGFARAWRTPSILAFKVNQRDPNIETLVGNPGLPAERLDSWELAYLGDWRRINMSLDVRHFRERLDDRLMVVRTGPSPATPYSEQSIQDISIRGYEFQWRWQPLNGTRFLLNHASMRLDSQLSANGRLIQATPGSNMTNPFDYFELAEKSAPRRSSSILVSQALPGGFDVSVARYWVDAIKWTRNTEADKYQRTDARIGYRFNWRGQKGELAYTQQSVDGAHVEQRDAGRKPNQRTVDRRHWVSLRLDF